jgi:hypothetical protein
MIEPERNCLGGQMIVGRRRVVSVTVLLCLSTLHSGCATLFSGTNQPISIQSQPAGADVQINGMQMGMTPCQVVLKRGATQMLQVSKNGYEPQTVMLGTKFNGWFIANLVFGGIIGMIIDLATGAYVWVDPEFVMVRLVEKRPSADNSEKQEK